MSDLRGQFALLVGAVAAVLCGALHADENKAWGLRDHYSFKSDTGEFRFDVQTGEWRIDLTAVGVLIDCAWAEIELAGGETVALKEFVSTDQQRSTFESGTGKGTYFRSVYPNVNGLEVEYSVARFSDRPFLTLLVKVKNVSQEPVHVVSLRPAVFGPGVIQNLDRSTTRTAFYTAWRGGYPIPQAPPDASLVRFQIPQPEMTLGIGLLQSGMADSRIIFEGELPSLTGYAESQYDPPLRLEPGESVESDPVWLSVYLPEAELVHQHHAWAEFTFRGRTQYLPAPNAWVTVDSRAGFNDLLETAKSWNQQTIIRHALIPFGWESQPGSHSGSTPRYPRDMRAAAGELRKLGMNPGITIDPLSIADGKGSGVVTADDGSLWLYPGNADARKELEKRAKRLTDAGFGFFVVPPTGMPDATLTHLKLTRAHAYSLALEMLRAAVPDAAVVPSPAITVGFAPENWHDAASATVWYPSMGHSGGAIRFEMGEMRDVSADLAENMRDYHGSIEIVGRPSRRNVGVDLAAALDKSKIDVAVR